ncbi:hypothetical protein K9M59_02500 [Candidatus Gracilibacteria bacterium]|nr:hypothetical protein [Candidatus Gracilibacteria bacterium]MCF7819711.1 hypothetical protein [Candidatus Gracilibacteria bacterium]
MKTKTLVFGTLALSATLFLSSAQAFWGFGHGKGLTEEKFTEMKSLFLNNDFQSFQTAMEAKREAMKAQHEQMKTMRETISRTVENIDNGIIMTITSDNAEAVEHILSRHDGDQDKMPAREDVQKTIEQLSNGVRITITSDDPEVIERIQSRHSGEKEGRGWGKGGKMGYRGLSRKGQQMQNSEGKNREFAPRGRGFGRGGRFQDVAVPALNQ